MSNELRYNISDWHQLSNVESNISDDLYVRVSDIIDNPIISGLRIRIMHKRYGDLYSCILNASGSLISQDPSVIAVEPTTEDILKMLAKFGFLVTFTQYEHLPKPQLDFLATVLNLGYDKLRLLAVQLGDGTAETHVVVFNIAENPEWLNNGYSPSMKEYMNALGQGSVINLSAVSITRNWSWSWLNFVANIQDILDENHYVA